MRKTRGWRESWLGLHQAVVASRLLALAAILSAPMAHSAARANDDERRPNVVLIVADDAGYADIGSFGSEISTPTLDSLAAVGVRFTDFYVGPTCSPTRSMMLSGVDNHRAGVGNMAEFTAPNQKGKPGYEGYLNQRVAPVSALLKDAGYHTYMAGKWHLGDEHDYLPAARGFERDLTLVPGGGSHFEDMWGIKGEKQLYTRNGTVLTELRPGFHSSVDYTNAIIGDIEENRSDGKPFFAYLAFQAPHDPFQLPDDWLDRYRGRYDQGYDATRAQRIERMKRLGILAENATTFPRLGTVPAWDSLSSGEKAESSRKMELFAAMVEHMDWNIGRLVQYLKDKGLYDDTVFIFLSDNGPEGTSWKVGPPWDNSRMEDWGKRGTFVQYGAAWAQVGAGPFRMFKGYQSEGGIRTPMIVAGHGVVAGGRLSRAVTHVTDVPATILKIANVSSPTVFDGRPVLPLQGRDFLPILQDPQAIVRKDTDWIGGEVFGSRSIRQGDWKLLWLCQPAGPTDWQLYNLSSDPGEIVDLAGSQPEIKARLVRHWEEYVRTNNVIIPTDSPVCASAKP